MKSSLFGISIFHWLGALTLIIMLFTWIAYQQGLLEQAITDTEIRVPIRVPFNPECDLRAGPCVTTLDDGSQVSFEIQQKTIPVAKTLDIEVKVSGLAVESIMLDINGVNMKMPPNRVELKPSGLSQFNGQAGLMFCTRDAMEWETVVELKTSKGQINVPYRFITISDGNF